MAALTVVQTTAKTYASAAGSIAVTLATPPTVGNGLALILLSSKPSVAVTYTAAHCTDNQGNAWALGRTLVNIPVHATIFYCAKVATTGAPFTITVNPLDSPINFVAVAIEIANVGTGMVLDKTGSLSGTTNVPGTGSVTLGFDESLVIACCALNAAQTTITVQVQTPAWVQIFEELPLTYVAGEGASRTRSGAAGTLQNSQWTISTSTIWSSVMAVFAAGTPLPAQGALVFTGRTPTRLITGVLRALTEGALGLTGTVPTLVLVVGPTSVPAGALALGSAAPTIAIRTTIALPAQPLVLAGPAPTRVITAPGASIITVPVRLLTLGGPAPTVSITGAPPPPNTTPATAIPITTFPFEVAVDPTAGTVPLYYKLVGPPGYACVGVYSDNSTWAAGHYLSEAAILDADGVTAYLNLANADGALQVPIVPGQVLYIQLQNLVGTYTPGDLVQLSVVLPPNEPLARGDLLINDDTNGFALCAVTPGGAIRRFQTFPAGERGAILQSGVSLWQDRSSAGFNPGGTGVTGNLVQLADAALAPLASIPGVIADTDAVEPVIVSNHTTRFYVVQSLNHPTLHPLVRTITAAGVIEATTWDLPGVDCRAACPNGAETILYHGTWELNAPVRRYDLVNHVALPDFLPGQGINTELLKDILVLADDTVVLGHYTNDGDTQTFTIRHLSPAGTLLRKWDYDGNNGLASLVANRLTFNVDNTAASFWLWLYYPVDPDHTFWESDFLVASRFVELSTATGAVLQTIDIQNYEAGLSTESLTWNGQRFGPSTSCPFLVAPGAPEPPEPGDYCTAGTFPIDPDD